MTQPHLQERLWSCPAAYRPSGEPTCCPPTVSTGLPTLTPGQTDSSTHRGVNAHKQPRKRRTTSGELSPAWSAEDIWRANQAALFKICSCPCQSSGPSLPHHHSEMNSYCLWHFISSSYPWLVALKEVSSWRQAPENHLRSKHLPVSPVSRQKR